MRSVSYTLARCAATHLIELEELEEFPQRVLQHAIAGHQYGILTAGIISGKSLVLRVTSTLIPAEPRPDDRIRQPHARTTPDLDRPSRHLPRDVKDTELAQNRSMTSASPSVPSTRSAVPSR